MSLGFIAVVCLLIWYASWRYQKEVNNRESAYEKRSLENIWLADVPNTKKLYNELLIHSPACGTHSNSDDGSFNWIEGPSKDGYGEMFCGHCGQGYKINADLLWAKIRRELYSKRRAPSQSHASSDRDWRVVAHRGARRVLRDFKLESDALKIICKMAFTTRVIWSWTLLIDK